MTSRVESEKSQDGVRIPTGPGSRLAVQHVRGAAEQVQFLFIAEQCVALVDPAVHCYLVALFHVGGDLVGAEQGADRGNVEGGRSLIAAEQLEDPRHANPGAVLSLRHPPR